MGKVKVGVIGCGMMGEFHLSKLQMIESCKVEAICDAKVERLKEIKERFKVPGAYSDVKEMFTKERLDCVFICTPDSFHFQPFYEASKHVQYIFIEKPISSSYEEAQKMLNTIKEKSLNVLIGFTERFYQKHMEIHKLLGEKELGKIFAVNATRINNALLAERVAFRDSIITFLAIHDIDLLCWMFGPVNRVYAEAEFNVFGPEVEDTSSITLRFKNGIIGNIFNTWSFKAKNFDARTTLEVFGENGVYFLDSYDDSLKLTTLKSGNIFSGAFNRDEAVLGEDRFFVDKVLKNEKIIDSAETATYALKVALASKESALKKKPINID